MARVLVVEDEPNLRTLLCRMLGGEDHDAVGVPTGAEAVDAAIRDLFDLVILDLKLPDMSGDEVMRSVLDVKPRSRFLVLSSVTDLARRVAVLDNGAIDFLAKPFAKAELLARVRVHMREEASDAPVINGSVRLDVHRRELFADGRRIELSHREFVLLSHMLRRKGRICTRQELLSDVWGIEFDTGTNVVDVYVRRLRAKLSPNMIETVRNVGYRLVAS